jgi:hypothetical protein
LKKAAKWRKMSKKKKKDAKASHHGRKGFVNRVVKKAFWRGQNDAGQKLGDHHWMPNLPKILKEMAQKTMRQRKRREARRGKKKAMRVEGDASGLTETADPVAAAIFRKLVGQVAKRNNKTAAQVASAVKPSQLARWRAKIFKDLTAESRSKAKKRTDVKAPRHPAAAASVAAPAPSPIVNAKGHLGPKGRKWRSMEFRYLTAESRQKAAAKARRSLSRRSVAATRNHSPADDLPASQQEARRRSPADDLPAWQKKAARKVGRQAARDPTFNPTARDPTGPDRDGDDSTDFDSIMDHDGVHDLEEPAWPAPKVVAQELPEAAWKSGLSALTN